MISAQRWAGETAPAKSLAGEWSADWHAGRLRQWDAAVRVPQAELPLLQVNTSCNGNPTGLVLDHRGSLPAPRFHKMPLVVCPQKVMPLDMSSTSC